tara:strand:+ start:476 stop:1297 length:822 start_codon:yes stop_codon:yes gene_type:complete
MFNLTKGFKYSRKEVHKIVTKSDGPLSYHFSQTGYGRVDEDMFLFINFDYEGKSGHIFPNEFDKDEELLIWYGKKETHSKQPLMRNLINGSYTPYCFGRWDKNSDFIFLGIGKILDFKDGVEVINVDGKKTFCIQFKISCKDTSHTSVINNYDETFEDGIRELGTEGLIRYRRHKTRERNPEIIKRKKEEFLKQHGYLFCEVCNFNFNKTYGKRGKGFIECHHNIPLHEQDGERITLSSDLTLLCSNCHRMIHRKKKWLTVDELKNIINHKDS